MTKIEGQTTAEKEIAAIRDTLQEEAGALRELFQPGIRMALIVGEPFACFRVGAVARPLTFMLR